MVLMAAIGVAAYTYATKNKNGDVSDSDSNMALPPSEPLQEDFLENLRSIDLLPLERTLTLFESPNATITFMDGCPEIAAKWLRARVGAVVYRNPWLGGYLAKDKKRRGAISLFYDPSSDEVNPYIFTAFEAGTIDVTRKTKFEDLGAQFAGHDVVVRCNAELIGRDQPLFRVCVIPDTQQPTTRFALVVSMSHVAGDGFTYHKIFKFLSTNCKVAEIEEMNPVRKHDFTDAVYNLCGTEEAFYVDKISRSPIWSAFAKKDDNVISRAAFFIDETWVEEQKEAWEKTSKIQEAEQFIQSKASKDLNISLAAVGEDDEVLENDFPGEVTPHAIPPATAASSTAPNFKVSFAAHQTATHITTNDIITSWFFRTCDVTVGMMPYMLRNRLPQFCENDAGNYAITIPFSKVDYLSPLQIRDSRPKGRRVHTQVPLPDHKAENRYGVSIDWRGVGFKKGGLLLGPNGEFQQVLHLPCYQSHDYKYIPKNFSLVHLFNAGPHGEPAVCVVCPDFVMDRIHKSGIVKSIINESKIANSKVDTFNESIREARQGRRSSIYAGLVDADAAGLLGSKVLGAIGDIDEEED